MSFTKRSRIVRPLYLFTPGVPLYYSPHAQQPHPQQPYPQQPQQHDPVPLSGLRDCSWTFCLVVVAVSLGGPFQSGFSVGNMANTLPLIQKSLGVTHASMSMVVAANPVGGLIGVIGASYLVDTLGRRLSMILNVVPIFVGCSLLAESSHYGMFLAGRLLVGMGVGVASVTTNVFLAEIAPVSIRGGVGALWGFTLTLGTLVSFLLSVPAVIGNSDVAWKMFMTIPIVPAVLQSTVLYFSAESPVFLAHKTGDMKAAGDSLVWYRKRVLQSELAQLTRISGGNEAATKTAAEILSDPKLRLSFILGSGLIISQQFSGINGIISYSTQVYTLAGVKEPTHAVIMSGVVRILGTLAAVYLNDRVGRVKLMAIGMLGVSISCVVLSLAQCCVGIPAWKCQGEWTGGAALVAVFLYFAFYGLGPSGIPNLFAGEIFPVRARGKGCSMCSIVQWICHAIMVVSFDAIDRSLAPHTFFMFASISGVATIVVILFILHARDQPKN